MTRFWPVEWQCVEFTLTSATKLPSTLILCTACAAMHWQRKSAEEKIFLFFAPEEDNLLHGHQLGRKNTLWQPALVYCAALHVQAT